MIEQETAKERQRELKDAKKELTTLRRELEKSRVQQAPVNPTPKSNKATPGSKKAPSATDSEAEQEVPKRRRRVPRRNGTASASDTDEVQEVVPPPHKPSQKTRKMSPVVEEEDVNEAEEITTLPAQTKEKEAEVTKPKPRPKPKPKPQTKAVEIPDDEEPVTPPLLATKRKRKASAEGSDVESEKPDKKVAKTASKAERTRAPDSVAKKTSTRAPSEPPASTAADPVQKQKKRKVNLFADAGSQPSQLGFEFGLGVGTIRGPEYLYTNISLQTNGFNLPTTLTPVRDVDGPVPNRAISGVMSAMGSMLRGRMGARR
jgi:hypothetical protein